MNRTHTTAILLLAALLATTGCNSRRIGDNIADAEKLEMLDLKIQKHPKDAALLAERGRVLTRLGRAKEGVYDLQQAVALAPAEVDYLMALADAHFANGDTDASYRTLAQAEHLAPERLDVHLKMGEITFYRRDYDRSLKSLSRVTEKEPDNRTALFMKGYIYKETSDTASAVSLYRKVCDLYPDYAPAFEELGILYATHGDPLAAEYLATAMRLDPNNTNAIYAMAMYHQSAGRMEEAETLYRQMLTLNPNSADAWHNLGYIELFHYRDYDRAIEYMTKAIEADSGAIEAWVNRGCAHELSGDLRQARADFEAALAIDSEYAPAIDGLNRTR